MKADPEQDFEIKLVVKLKGYGKRRHRYDLVQSVMRVLGHLGNAEVYYKGNLVEPKGKAVEPE